MRKEDSILQQFYMSKLPKAQDGLNSLIPSTYSRGDIASLPGVRKQILLSKDELAKNKVAVQQRVKAENAKILADRNARLAAAAKANAKPNKSLKDLPQQLADETQATGDKFRLFPNDPNSFIDDYINPFVFIGNMASKLGRVPLNIQQGNYGDAAMAVVEPLAAGAFEAVASPFIGNMFNKAVAPYARQIENAQFQAQRGLRKIIPGYVDRKMAAIDKGNQWTKDWYSNPIIKERYDNWVEKGSSYMTPKEAAFQASMMKHVDPDLLGSINLDKSYASKLSGTVARDNYDKLLEQGFFTKGTTDRSSGFTSNNTLARYSHGPNDALVDVLHPEFRAGSKTMANTTVHENIHAITKGDDGLTSNAKTALRKPFAKGDGNYDKYLRKATEVHARIGELRRQFGLNPEQEVDINTMNRIMDLGLKGKTTVDQRWFELVNDKRALRWLFNNAPAVAAPVAGAALLDQKNNGGPIVDPRQQKNYQLGKSSIQGVGAFAKKDLNPGDYIGKVHTINKPFVDYNFTELGKSHNHSDNPNIQNVLVGNERHVLATRPIREGEELTSNYRLQPDLEQPEDFQMQYGGLLSRSVTCSNCGHSWKSVEGGMDPLNCHKCGGMVKMQNGGLWNSNKVQWVDSVNNANMMKNFVQREYLKNGPSMQVPGEPGRSTHLMAYDPRSKRVYPEIVNINGKLKYLPGDQAYDYADSTGQFITFPTAEQAAWYSNNGYKTGTGVTIGKKESGGQHGGLDRWFAEKWVDVKTGKDCGRQEGEKRAGYPACRPSKRVSSQTPKTSSEMSSAEKAKFKRNKTSSERINYNHKRN